jgi:hypothetical protein
MFIAGGSHSIFLLPLALLPVERGVERGAEHT